MFHVFAPWFVCVSFTQKSHHTFRLLAHLLIGPDRNHVKVRMAWPTSPSHSWHG